MSKLKALAVVSVVAVMTYSFAATSRTFAQSKLPAGSGQEPDQTLKQLLIEVHELRLAVQKATVNSTRFQMLIERARVEQTHVESLGRDLESVRLQIHALRERKPEIEQQIKDAEDGLDRASDPNVHAELESRIKVFKPILANLGPEEERQRNRETALDSELQASQARLSELNSKLDALLSELKAP
jgi:predicted  nucleic acid-binding Zn-ribbon protein